MNKFVRIRDLYTKLNRDVLQLAYAQHPGNKIQDDCFTTPGVATQEAEASSMYHSIQ